jgi:hypothetical protein
MRIHRKPVIFPTILRWVTTSPGSLVYVVTILYIWKNNNFPLTVFLASSWGHVNQLGRSYVTQGDRKIRDLPPLPPPLPPATVVQWRPRRVPGFSRLQLSRAGISSYWPERAAHSQSEWRRPTLIHTHIQYYDDETSQVGHMWLTHSWLFYILKVL